MTTLQKVPPPLCTCIRIPQGEACSKLLEDGMVAKMKFESTWTEQQINAEVYSLFHHLFEDENDCKDMFSFQYLRYEIEKKQDVSFCTTYTSGISIDNHTGILYDI